MMRLKILVTIMLVGFSTAYAQQNPIVMTIGGQPITKSEFEYSYNNQNSLIQTGIHSTLDEFVNNFIDYKLKVITAQKMGLDTLASFKQELSSFYNKEARNTSISDVDVAQKAHEIYNEKQRFIDSSGGLLRLAEIFVRMKQHATGDEERAAKLRIDSIYDALQHGSDFATLAKKCSDDKVSAQNGGLLGWMNTGSMLTELGNEAFALQVGQMSRPFLAPDGWYIIVLKGKSNYFPYDSVRENIIKDIDAEGLRKQIIDANLGSISEASQPQIAPDMIATKRQNDLEIDHKTKYLMQEYRDGLLIMALETQREEGVKDSDLEEYFNKNKKKYRWDAPKFKGIVCYTKSKSYAKAVQKLWKRIPIAMLSDSINIAFGNRVHVETGLFQPGDNSLVDKEVFKKEANAPMYGDFTIGKVYGKKLKKPENFNDVRSYVMNDYCEYLDKEWVKTLRKTYPVVINRNVLATINKQ